MFLDETTTDGAFPLTTSCPSLYHMRLFLPRGFCSNEQALGTVAKAIPFVLIWGRGGLRRTSAASGEDIVGWFRKTISLTGHITSAQSFTWVGGHICTTNEAQVWGLSERLYSHSFSLSHLSVYY